MIGAELLNLFGGDPSSQIAQTLGGPNPNPGAPPPGGAPGPGGGSAAPGGSGGPSGAPAAGPPQPQPPMAPSQATQSPPDLAALYVKLHDRDMAANEIDRGTALMASAFGTAQQQHDMMNYAQNMPQNDSTGALSKGILAQGEMTKNQAAQQQLQEHTKFMAGAAGMSTLLGVTPEQATWLANDPAAMKEVLTTHFNAMAPTDAIKNVNAAADAYAKANPSASPQEIQQYKAGLLSGIATGGDMTMKEMGAANRAWDADPANKGQQKPSWLTNPAEYKGHVGQVVEDQKDIGAAKNSYGANIAKLQPVQDNIAWLQAHPNETAAAIQHPELTSGNLGYYTGGFTMGQGALSARQRLDWLNDQLYSTSFTSGGGQRLAATEAQRLGSAFSPFKGPNASEMTQGDINNALKVLKDNSDSAIANTKAAAGFQLTPQEGKTPYLNKNFFDPSSSLHSGATIAQEGSKAAPSGGKTYTYNPKTGQLE